MGDVLALALMVLLVSCAVLVLLGWSRPESRFMIGLLQIRRDRSPKRPDPRRDAAVVCWSVLGSAAASVGLVISRRPEVDASDVSGGSLLVLGCAGIGAVCLGLAAWVLWGSPPQLLRPAALREPAPGPPAP